MSNSDQPQIKEVAKNNISFRVVVNNWGNFWRRVECSDWEPQTFQIFDEFIDSDCIYIDVGAWIGPTVLYAAQFAKFTYAFEPDPVAFRELKSNITANNDSDWISRVVINNKAISSASGTLRIGSRGGGGDSMSSALFSDEGTSWEVEAITIDQLVETEGLQHMSMFIKMDIEGGEYELIPELTRFFDQHDVNLYLSMHPEFHAISLKQKDKVKMKFFSRFLLAWHQLKLLLMLPFKYLYGSNGVRLNLFILTLKSLVKGEFIHEVVATNKRWKKS